MAEKIHNVEQSNKTAHKWQSAKQHQDLAALPELAEPVSWQQAMAQPTQARPAGILGLQRAAGNRAVSRLIQTKLTVGPAGDRYEQEADRMAEQVMQMSERANGQMGARPGPGMQRQEEEEELQAKPLAATITPLVQRQEDEEELQMAPLAQRQEEEEELQMKPLVQRQEDEEEIQTKPLIQRQEDEEELQMMPFVQRQEDEEELQTKPFVQRQEDEEELQMMPFVQRQEDEEEIQTKPLLQRQEDEEEIQTKPFVQRQEDEEELQMKPLVQRQEEEEELQMKPFVQRQEDEEEIQTKPLLQRQEDEEELQMKPVVQRQEDEEEIQTKPLVQRQEDEEELQMAPLVQRRGGGGFEAGPELEGRLAAQKGGGSPLPDDVRGVMEPRFGADFGGVRVHTGGEAAQLNKELRAQAFTHGQDIYLGSGRYDPGTTAGKRLLAHELTHVIQQTGDDGLLHGGATVQRLPEEDLRTLGISQQQYDRISRLLRRRIERALAGGRPDDARWLVQQALGPAAAAPPAAPQVAAQPQAVVVPAEQVAQQPAAQEEQPAAVQPPAQVQQPGAEAQQPAVVPAAQPAQPAPAAVPAVDYTGGTASLHERAMGFAGRQITAIKETDMARLGQFASTMTGFAGKQVRQIKETDAPRIGKMVKAGVVSAPRAVYQKIAPSTPAPEGATRGQRFVRGLRHGLGVAAAIPVAAVTAPAVLVAAPVAMIGATTTRLAVAGTAAGVGKAGQGIGIAAAATGRGLAAATAASVGKLSQMTKKEGPLSEVKPGAIAKPDQISSQMASAAALSASVEERVQALIDAFEQGGNRFTRFNRIALALSGEGVEEVATGFQQKTQRTIGAEIDRVFAGFHKYTADYLKSLVRYDGTAPLEMEAALAMGLVTSTATDDKRVVELLEGAPLADFRRAWDLLKDDVRAKCDETTYRRLESLSTTEEAKAASAAGPGAWYEKRDELARIQVQRLVDLVKSYAKTAGRVRGVEIKPLIEDIKAWRLTASREAVERAEGNAELRQALESLPRSAIGGMNDLDRHYLQKLAGAHLSIWGAETPERMAAAVAALDVKASIIRYGLRGWFGRKIKERKHGALLEMFNRLTDAERDKLLAGYDTRPGLDAPEDRARAIQALDDELKQRNVDDDERAAIMARVRHGRETGSHYQALWQLVRSGKTSTLKRALPVFPIKWTSFSEAALKIVQQLEPEEYGQVRGDAELLRELRERCYSKSLTVKGHSMLSGPEHWKQIATILNVPLVMGPVQEGPSAAEERALVEHTPAHWAELLKLEIGGRFKSVDVNQMYLLIYQAQRAARIKDPQDADRQKSFMMEVYNALESGHKKFIGKHQAAKDALLSNTPLSTEFLFQRAAGKDHWYRWRSRQAMFRVVEGIEGAQLLAEWSNIAEFSQLVEGERHGTEALAGKLAERDQLNGQIRDADPQAREALQKKLNQTQQMIDGHVDMLHRIHHAKSAFVLGINEQKRAFLHKELPSSDQVAFEQMVMARLLRAAEQDAGFQQGMADKGLEFDAWMHARMKGLKSLESQRHLDTTIQWNRFSSKGAQLDAATRKVIGTARSGFQAIKRAERGAAPRPGLAQIKERYAEKTEKALLERDVAESRFKEIQAKFKSRAGLVVQLLVAAALAAIIAGVTFGAGLTLSPLIVAGVTAGLSAIKDLGMALYQYKVEGKPLKNVIATALVNIFADAISVATVGAGMALEAAFMGAQATANWLAPSLGQALGKAAGSLVTGVPEMVVQRFVAQKPIEEAIKDGEGITTAIAVKVGKSLALDWALSFAMNYAFQVVMLPSDVSERTPEQQMVASAGAGMSYGERYAAAQQASAKGGWGAAAAAVAAPALIEYAKSSEEKALDEAEQLRIAWEHEQEKVKGGA